VQISKAQKDIDDLTVFFALLGSANIKASKKHVGEIDPRGSLNPGKRAFKSRRLFRLRRF